MRVLIIDDDEDVVFSLQTILCAKGVEVVGTGTDGSEAVKLYEELQPDFINGYPDEANEWAGCGRADSCRRQDGKGAVSDHIF